MGARDIWDLFDRSLRALSGQSAHDITILYPVSTATMDTLKRKKRQAYLALYSPTKLHLVSDLNVDLFSDRLVAEGYG